LFLKQDLAYIVQAGLRLEIFLPQAAEGWDYKYTPPHPAYADFLLVIVP
jgi:hypothetical protein